MELKFNQEQMLALYYELYDECYNIKDAKRERKMQNCCYFFQHFSAFDGSYCFTRNLGIFSPSLQRQINDLNKKEKEILKFYQNYLEKSNEHYFNYSEQLKAVLNGLVMEEVIPNLALDIYMVKNIVKTELGMDILCAMLYIIEIRHPGLNDFNKVNEILEEDGYDNNLELKENIWQTLKFLGLSKIEAQERKLTI